LSPGLGEVILFFPIIGSTSVLEASYCFPRAAFFVGSR
jgi:hypothetical protein